MDEAEGQHLPGARRIVVAALGDSITAGNLGWDPDPERRELEDPGDDETSQYLYWAQARDPRDLLLLSDDPDSEHERIGHPPSPRSSAT